MAPDVNKTIELEIGHVLFIDIVGYSKLLINEQSDLVQHLKEMVRGCEQVRAADADGKLIRLATGDGMALVFRNSPEAPAQCALELARADKEHPELQLRMGIHSGPINEVTDVNERANVTGAGINVAQRVMDCGDAGHILLSQHVVDDLEQYPRWRPLLHELGECEVKHGVRIGVVNFYDDEIGNPQVPKKFRGLRQQQVQLRWGMLAAAVLLLAAIVAAAALFVSHKPTPVNSAASASSHEAVSPGIPEKSIAVLPFENLSSDKENAYFTDGVQDEILMDLAKIADLKVISRTSVMPYKTGAARNLREIGQQLGVAHLLEGSVQRTGGKVRVNAQLIDARSDAHLWAQTYDRDLADVFAIQSEIAKTIADQLQATLSPNEKAAIEKPPTSDLAAYELYLRAEALFSDLTDPIHSKEKLPQAARLLNEAVARDPHFLLGWCLLCRVHCNIYWQGHDHTPARLDLANAAAQTALQLQPEAGEAHLALADYYYHGFRDYGRARAELAIARRTLPNNAEVFAYTGYIDRRAGRWEDSTRNLERALELDPRNFLILQQLELVYEAQHRFADAVRVYGRALTIVPGDPGTRINRAQLAIDWRADVKPWQEMLATLIAEDPSVGPDVDDPNHALCERTPAAAARGLANCPPDGIAQNGANTPRSYFEGLVARFLDDAARAQVAFASARCEVAKVVAEQPDHAAAVSLLGLIDAGLGHKEEALREGRRACELLPISKDAVDGMALAVNLAQIYAWTGDKDLAIEQIAAVERFPNRLSYGLLKLHPNWDSLRGDPRFEKVVADLAPKGTPKEVVSP